MRSSWPINRLYSALVILLVLAAGAYLCWEVATNRTARGGGAVRIKMILLVFALICGWATHTGWSLYRSARTSFDDQSISQPGLRGHKIVRWAEIRSFQGGPAQLCLSDGRTKIILAPFRHRDPMKVLSDVRSRVPLPPPREMVAG